jgi:uncharacterized membrane protein
MSGPALAIVLLAALFHAGWNLLAKNSRKKMAFIWWFILIATIGYLPMFLYFRPGLDLRPVGRICIIVSGILHALYFWFMGGAYERGDLSLVYPISRGSGPLFVPVLAVIFLQEQLAVTGAMGIVLVVLGIYVIHLEAFTMKSFSKPLRALRGSASLWALCTGGTIAGYSLIDKVGVGLVYPPAYIYLMFVIALLLLSPYVLTKERVALKLEWQVNRGPILIAGFLVLFTYLMILFAFRFSKVSYVVAVREVSIVFSALLGILWLKEPHAPQKIAGSLLIALGVVFIGFSN